MTDQPRLLGGRYELGALLGRGGMAEVRHARDLRLNRDVAVKQLRVDLASDPTFQERFRREARSAAGLNHPNIVGVYDTGEEIDPPTGIMVPYIVMELVEGHTLRELLRTGRQIQPMKALEFTVGVLEALSYSHKAGIVHRDIKPANVMLTPDGTIKVMDFGIARAVSDTSSTMTQTAAVIGTAQYLSPEQARGETVDARSDIYSTGCLLYELLVGRPPFTGDSPVSVAYQHVRELPTPPSELDSMITSGMDAVVLKALAKDPEDRYQTASAMRADLGRLLAGEDVFARRRPPVQVPPSALAATQVVSPMVTAPADAEITATRQAARALATPPQQKKLGLWIFIAALAVLTLTIGMLVYFNQQPTVAKVNVPVVTDMRQDAAEQALEQVGLKPVVMTEQGPDGDSVGRVIKQDPLPDASVDVGSEVQIVINLGPTKGTIPGGLVGQPCTDVVTRLNLLGFPNVTSQEAAQEPNTATEGQVVSVLPAEGDEVAVETPILVSCATGKSKMPSVRGKYQDDAELMLKNAGFEDIKIVEKKTNSAPEGTVIEQSPSMDEMVDRTEKVTITVAVPEPVEPPPTVEKVKVPEVMGKSQDEAKKTLEGAGLKPMPSGDLAGQVISQDPLPNVLVDVGSEVQIVIGVA